MADYPAQTINSLSGVWRFSDTRPFRIGQWCIFLCLTLGIIIYPTFSRYSSEVLWSPDIFVDLPRFTVLFYLWTISLGVIILLPINGNYRTWERLIIVGIFALVFRGYWNFIAPAQGQALAHFIDATLWQTAGNIFYSARTGYYDFPGASISLLTTSQLLGLSLLPTITILTTAICGAVGIITYSFLLKVFGDSLIAALISVLIIATNIANIIFFTAGPVAFIFVVLLLLIYFGKGAVDTPSKRFLSFFPLFAATITHFTTAMIFGCLMGSLWLFSHIHSSWKPIRPNHQFVALTILIPIVWLFLWGDRGYVAVTSYIWFFLQDPFGFLDRFAGIFTTTQVNFGEAAPRWYSFTRLTWVITTYLLGSLAWIWALKNFRKTTLTEKRFIATFAGIGFFAVILSVISVRGFWEIIRALTFVPFFSLPLLILLLQSRSVRYLKATLIILSSVYLLLAVPTFLSSNRVVLVNSLHEVEFSFADTLKSIYNDGEGLTVHLGHPDMPLLAYQIPKAQFLTDTEAESKGFTPEVRWMEIENLTNSFLSAIAGSNPSIFISSPKLGIVSQISFGIKTDDNRWKENEHSLAIHANRTYTNGQIKVFSGR